MKICFDQESSQKVVAILLEDGKSQKEVAEILGTSENYVKCILNGKKLLKEVHLDNLASAVKKNKVSSVTKCRIAGEIGLIVADKAKILIADQICRGKSWVETSTATVLKKINKTASGILADILKGK